MSLTPSDRSALSYMIEPKPKGVGWSTDRPMGASVRHMLDTGEITDPSVMNLARNMWQVKNG